MDRLNMRIYHVRYSSMQTLSNYVVLSKLIFMCLQLLSSFEHLFFSSNLLFIVIQLSSSSLVFYRAMWITMPNPRLFSLKVEKFPSRISTPTRNPRSLRSFRSVASVQPNLVELGAVDPTPPFPLEAFVAAPTNVVGHLYRIRARSPECSTWLV